MKISLKTSMKKAIILPLLMPLLFLFISSSSCKATDLDKLVTSNYNKLLWQQFNLLTSTTRNKARYLKQRKFSSFFSNITLFADAFSASIPLSFGTPPQQLHFILDTGSSITWTKCDNQSDDPKYFSIFHPSLSSSSKYLTCNDPKHKLFAREKVQRCPNCQANNSKNCLQLINFEIQYDVGSTKGTYMSDVLSIHEHTISDYVVGCSLLSTTQSSGIAGFGRGIESFPSQTGIKKFSYCLPRIQHNEKSRESYLILNSQFQMNKLTYTPILNSAHVRELKRYYVVLENIIIGPKSIRILGPYIVPRNDGNGGTVLDSGSSLTSMESSLFEIVRQEFQTQLGKHRFVGFAKHKMPCFNISGKELNSLPKLTFKFNGGAVMNLPKQNYIVETTEIDISCLSIVSQAKANYRWPAIVLGNTMLRDFYLEFDLVRNRFGFQAIKC